MEQVDEIRKATVVPPDHGPVDVMGRMRAIFKADGEETSGRYSILERRPEPKTQGPGVHFHSDDHIFYLIEGSVTLFIDGRWSRLERGGYAIIPGGTPHDFENRETCRSGVISVNTPGGFETKICLGSPPL